MKCLLTCIRRGVRCDVANVLLFGLLLASAADWPVDDSKIGGAIADEPICRWQGVSTMVSPWAPAHLLLRPGEPQRVDADGDPLPAGALVRIGTTRFRPGGVVGALAFAAGGKELVSVNSTTGVQVWDPATGKLLRQYGRPDRGHPPVAVAADGMLAVVLENRQWVFRDTATGQIKAVLAEPKDATQRAALSPDGKLFALAGWGSTAGVWELATGKTLVEPAKHGGRQIDELAFAPDKRSLAVLRSQDLVELWDVATGIIRWQTRPDAGNAGYWGGAFSRDGKTLAVRTGMRDGIHFYDVEKGTLRLALPKNDYFDHAFTPDGKSLVTTDHYREIAVWDVATGQRSHHFPIRAHGLWHLAVSPDGKWVAGADDHNTARLRLWSLSDGKERRPDDGPRDYHLQAQFLSDGKTIASTHSEWWHGVDRNAPCCRWWDAATGKHMKGIAWPGKEDHFASLSADGKLLAVAEQHGNLRLYDVATGKTRTKFPATGDLQFMDVDLSADGRHVVVNACRIITPGLGGTTENLTLVFDAATAKLMHTWRDARGFSRHCPVTQDGATIALLVEAPRYDQRKIVLKSLGTGARLNRLELRIPWSSSVVLSPSGCFIAVLDWHPSILSLHEAATGSRLYSLPVHDDPAYCCAFSPTGRLLATGNRTGDLHIWDVMTGKKVATLVGHRGPINSVAFSPDGRRLVSAGADTTLLVWDSSAWPDAANLAAAKVLTPDPWETLASKDASLAARAMAVLVSSPDSTLKLLGHHLRQTPAEQVKHIRELIDALDDPRFATREEATTKLKQLGAIAAPVLEKRLAENPPLEVRARVDKLLREMPDIPLPSDAIRTLRALKVLEWLHTPGAVEMLTDLSRGEPDGWLTQEATAARGRVK
jgi:WD40 repeat protein